MMYSDVALSLKTWLLAWERPSQWM